MRKFRKIIRNVNDVMVWVLVAVCIAACIRITNYNISIQEYIDNSFKGIVVDIPNENNEILKE